MPNPQRSAGGAEKMGRQMHKRRVEKAQWTIKGLDQDTIEKSRVAARKRGMRIGAWVAEALEQAACGELNDRVSVPSYTEDQIRQMLEGIETRLSQDLRQIKEKSIETEKDVRVIQRTLLESLSALAK